MAEIVSADEVTKMLSVAVYIYVPVIKHCLKTYVFIREATLGILHIVVAVISS